MTTRAFQKIYTKIENITKATVTLRAEGVGNDELATVGGKLAQVVKIMGDQVTLQVFAGTEGIVLVPLALYSMFTGQFWLGLVVIILYSVSGNLDPVMRTKLIPKQIQQSVAVTMIATFCGIAYFGMLGVVYGPIIMLLVTTTLELYAERKKPVA
jgi:hypothetical protein